MLIAWFYKSLRAMAKAETTSKFNFYTAELMKIKGHHVKVPGATHGFNLGWSLGSNAKNM